MHSDQIDVSLSLASGLIQSQFPQFRGEKIVALDTAGTVNAIFRIGTAHVARLPLRRVDRMCQSATGRDRGRSRIQGT